MGGNRGDPGKKLRNLKVIKEGEVVFSGVTHSECLLRPQIPTHQPQKLLHLPMKWNELQGEFSKWEEWKNKIVISGQWSGIFLELFSPSQSAILWRISLTWLPANHSAPYIHLPKRKPRTCHISRPKMNKITFKNSIRVSPSQTYWRRVFRWNVILKFYFER